MLNIYTLAQQLPPQEAVEKILRQKNEEEHINNPDVIRAFMKEYKGKCPYLAFVLENVRSTSFKLFVRKGIKVKELDKLMRKIADEETKSQRGEEAC